MYKRIKIFLFAALLLTSGCSNKKGSFIINGTLSSNKYDGENIYLVPFKNPTREKVDSTKINNKTFRFEGTSDLSEFYIIKVPPLLKVELQELIVVKEKGIINVIIGQESSATGTPLNTSLQEWKENKINTDKLYFTLQNNYNQAPDTISKKKISDQIDSLEIEKKTFNYNFIKQNKNIVGEFVYDFYKNSFTEQQQKELEFE